MKKIYFILTLLLSTVSVCAWSQDGFQINGTVRDHESGEPLAGVFVVEKTNTSNYVMTDADGSWKLTVNGNSVLEFTSVGFETLTVAVEGRHTLDVTLKLQSELMEEIIVVGYSNQKRNDVTGAISKVSSRELNKVPVASSQQALQGRVAGVQVSAATGAPGADVSVRVRGVGSIFSDNAPLYIVDGIPSSTGLNNLSPNSIENITVLKDASSAAIYGSRASNGVVLITTKQGARGEAQISYNGSANLQVVTNLVDMVNTQEYVNIYNEAAQADNSRSTIKRSLITDDMLGNLADVNHLKEIFRPAFMHNHELSVSGGSDKFKYLVSGSYYGQDGVIHNSGYERGTINANLHADAKDWLKIGFVINGAISDTKEISSSGDGYGNNYGGSVVRYAMFRNPAIPVRDENGEFVDRPSNYFGKSVYDTFFGDGYNPVGLAENTDRSINDKSLFGKLNLNFILPAHFNINANMGMDYGSRTETIYNKAWGDDNRINNMNSLNVNQAEHLNWTFNTTLNYDNTFGKDHNFSALLGFEAIRESGFNSNNSDSDFPIWDKNVIFIGNGNGEKISSQRPWAVSLASFFFQANYNWKNRYYLSTILREDGTSRFVGKNRWGTFYAVSGGWTISNEPFMSGQHAISNLKLRAGYGAIGNQNVGIYAYSDHYAPNFNYPFGGLPANGYAQIQLGNENLKWETSRQLNIGLDMAFLDNTLGFSVDFFHKVTDDMLMQASYPPSTGNASTPWINSGKILNMGVDLEFFYHQPFRDGRFDLTLNGGYLHNEVLDISAPVLGARVDNGIFATKTEVGYPIGSFYMYEMDGIFQNDAEILTSAFQGNNIQPGDVRYVDHNKDGVIDSKDRVHLGSSIPTFTLGLNLSAEWKGLDVSAFFQGAFGQKIYNCILADSEGFYRGFAVTKRYYDNHWTPENPSNTYPRASWAAKSNNVKVSSRFLEDASYFRLKNLQIGYTFNTERVKAIERARLYISGTNLFTLTGYSGFDPEMTVSANSVGEGDRANGIDWGTYPACMIFSLGLNLTF